MNAHNMEQVQKSKACARAKAASTPAVAVITADLDLAWVAFALSGARAAAVAFVQGRLLAVVSFVSVDLQTLKKEGRGKRKRVQTKKRNESK